MALPDDYLVSPALDGTPAQAFASHKARAMGIAKYYASTRPLSHVHGPAGENEVHALIAHLHAATDAGDPTFAGSLPAVLAALHTLTLKNHGLVGTTGASTPRDYDMALKGLVIVLYRYRRLLSDADVDFIFQTLIPGHMFGGHRPAIEIVEQTFLNVDTPETENHLLMIESSRYLLNQLMVGRPGFDPVIHDNRGNGLTHWLLLDMQTIARHDFLEFNSRPYARMSLQALHNLYEFAKDPEIVTAAQILLDYQMVKFAVSSSRGRRVSPFRRHQEQINHQNSVRNDLYAESGDQVAGFFLGHTGLVDAAAHPAPFPSTLPDCGLIASTSTYRPPPAAYAVAMTAVRPHLHRFYHGNRPVLPAGEPAEPGLEIYYRSPSFVLSAGGSFLNSGYGRDALDIPGKDAWEQTSRAQAVTLIPTRLETRAFCDLLRFEPYPDPIVDPYADDPGDPDRHHTTAVNIGVGRGLIAGANLRPAEKKTVWEYSTSQALALASNKGRLLVAWQANDGVSVAKAQTTRLLGIDGVEGVEGLVRLRGEAGAVHASSDRAPALASHGDRLYLAWKGSGNPQLNLAFSDDGGATFTGARTFAQSSDHAPALISHAGRLVLAWTGRGNDKLNIAHVALFASTAGAFGIEGLEDQVVLDQSSDAGPALASHDGRLFVAWKGSGNPQLNLAFSDDGGATFTGARTFADSSDHAPALASHAGRLFLAWAGRGNDRLNIAQVALFASTAGAFGIEGLDAKVVLDDFSTEPPTLCSHDDQLFVAWKGEGDDNLNLRLSRDGTFRAPGPWLWGDLSDAGFYVAAYRTPPARPDHLEKPLDNLALVYAMEAPAAGADGMTFEQFKALTLERNAGLPARLDYGGFCEFHAPDNKRFRVLFKLTGDKYRARVVDLDDPIEDFSTLPLVSGEFLTAPGGFDGLIEFRDPSCEQARTVLDYRTLDNPIRTDNRRECPQPWIDRARALGAIGRQFNADGRTTDAQEALLDAVELWRELTVSAGTVVVAGELTVLAGQLGPAGLPDRAVETQELALRLLREFTPTDDERQEHLLALAEAQHNLIVRLIDAQRQADAVAAAPAAVAAYRRYVADAGSGADVMRLDRDLTPLQKHLLSVGLTEEPLAAVALLVDAYAAAVPPADPREFDISFAEARHNLIARLIDARRLDDAAAQSAEAITAYERYAAERGADRARAQADLEELARVLRAGGLDSKADSAQAAAAAIQAG